MGKASRSVRKSHKEARRKVRNMMAPQTSKAGLSVLYTYPFWIYVDTSLPLPVMEITLEDRFPRIYPPFRSAPANFISMPFINPQSIPSVSNFELRGNSRIKDVAAIPQLDRDADGTFSMHLTRASEWHNPPVRFPMDSIRIDIIGDLQGDDVPTEVSAKLMQQLRWRSHQWWIGRASDVSSGHIRNDFNVSRKGEPLSELQGRASGRTVNGDEEAIDVPLWQSAITDIGDGVEPPLYDVLLLDARYFEAAGDIRRSVLDSATACELAKNITYERLNLSKSGTDLVKHLSGILDEQINRSYEREKSTNYAIIKDLWIARGNIAHGKIAYRYSGQTVRIDGKRAGEFAQAAEDCVRWLERL